MIMYKLNIKIDDNFQIPQEQYQGKGKHCFKYFCPDFVRDYFGLTHKQLALKVFHTIEITDPTVPIFGYLWGDDPVRGQPHRNTNIFDATVIQNIAHWHGLAPKVYAILEVEWKNKIYLAQLVDDMTGQPFAEKEDDAYATYKRIMDLGPKYGFYVDKQDVSKWDKMGDKIIDFQTFRLEKNFREKFKHLYSEGTKWGKIYYHAVPGLDLNAGPRNMDQRIKEMKLDEVDFKGKTVLDLGCSGGAFTRYAKERGAKRVVGIDYPDCAEGAMLASNALGHFDIEYYGVDLTQTTTVELQKIIGKEKFDFVFYLSMFRHVHFPSFIWDLCGGTAIIEWNNWKGPNSENEIKKMVEEKFTIFLEGRTTDHGTGKAFWYGKPKK